MNYSYKELQTALKNLKNNGFDVQVKLNAKQEVLQTEYDRLMTIPEPLQQHEPLTTQEFNEMVGFTSYPASDASENLGTMLAETLETSVVNMTSEASEALVTKPTAAEAPSPLETIQTETLAPQLSLLPAPKNDNRLLQAPNSALERSKVANHPGYWIDGTELGDRLEATQTQAIRNLQDGWRSLKQLGKNLQSFKKGFDEGLRQVEAKKAAKPKMPEKHPESAIKPSKIPKKAKRLSTTQRLPTAA